VATAAPSDSGNGGANPGAHAPLTGRPGNSLNAGGATASTDAPVVRAVSPGGTGDQAGIRASDAVTPAVDDLPTLGNPDIVTHTIHLVYAYNCPGWSVDTLNPGGQLLAPGATTVFTPPVATAGAGVPVGASCSVYVVGRADGTGDSAPYLGGIQFGYVAGSSATPTGTAAAGATGTAAAGATGTTTTTSARSVRAASASAQCAASASATPTLAPLLTGTPSGVLAPTPVPTDTPNPTQAAQTAAAGTAMPPTTSTTTSPTGTVTATGTGTVTATGTLTPTGTVGGTGTVTTTNPLSGRAP